MAKKKKQNSVPRDVQPPKKKGVNTTTWIAGAVALIAVIAVFAAVSGGASGGSVSTTANGGGSSPAAIPADEAKYLGRLLPAGYSAPSVGAAARYTAPVEMTDVAATQDAKQVSVSQADLVKDKIVYFEYTKADGSTLPMLAYVKPSGKVFVGVSFCPPCQGKRQSIQPDGTLRCSSCGTKRDLETGAGISGACKLYPTDEVPAKVAGGKIVIDNAVLDGWTAQPLDRKVGA